jgi:hypothetical protein
MSVRLFHKHSRIVLRAGRDGAVHRWCSPRFRPCDWQAVFFPALDLLALRPVAGDGSVGFRIGSIHWTNSRYWSTITLRFTGGSARKRELVAAALLKAARYKLTA